jgi:hypothetical protein
MNRFRFPQLLLALPISLVAIMANVAAQDRVTVHPKRVVILRSGKLARDFPERKRAVVRYPILVGLSDVKVLRRIQNTLSVKNAFGTSLAEYRQADWLIDLDYTVNYNKNYLLDITFTQEGMGAYPSTSTKHFLINLRNGMVVKAADAFNPTSLRTLVAMANQKLRAETKELSQVVDNDKEENAEQKGYLKERLNQLSFTRQNLDEFSISDKGVTFLYDAGFPHVIQALQPDGQYFFTYAELRSFINANGPLGIFK